MCFGYCYGICTHLSRYDVPVDIGSMMKIQFQFTSRDPKCVSLRGISKTSHWGNYVEQLIYFTSTYHLRS